MNTLSYKDNNQQIDAPQMDKKLVVVDAISDYWVDLQVEVGENVEGKPTTKRLTPHVDWVTVIVINCRKKSGLTGRKWE